MPLQIAACDKLAQGFLFKARNGTRRVHRAIARHKLHRQNHEAQAQSRRKRPRKRVHIDDLTAALHRAESRRVGTAEAKLAVVVVLQNIATGFPRPAKQRFALTGLHLLAGRKLMGRGDIRRARAARIQRPDVDCSIAKRRRHNPRTAGDQYAPHAGIAGVFHGKKAFAPDKRNERGNQHLRSRTQNDGVRRDIHAAHPVQIAGNLPAKCRVALRVAGKQQGRALLAEHLAHQPRPRRVGKMPRICRACSKIPANGRLFGSLCLCRRKRLAEGIDAASGAAFASPFADEPRIRRFNRRRADIQMRRQLTLGGHAFARADAAALHVPAQGGIQLLGQRRAAAWIQIAGEHRYPSTSQCAHSRT